MIGEICLSEFEILEGSKVDLVPKFEFMSDGILAYQIIKSQGIIRRILQYNTAR